MYSTCLFCNGALGADDAIEHFPVGRRLAFDSARGRLWVVCGRDGALRAARLMLPGINARGAGRQAVRYAVGYLEDGPDAARLFAHAARTHAFTERWKSLNRAILLKRLPMSIRLALEMAAHEEPERRALEGELHLLEAEWKTAEEIASIADDMFLPPSVNDELERLRRESP
ncbi:MAG: hypothetical protein JWL60_872 [Gemmatimonadetes bacterium]|nr:hypothetical protein [Gemmatimonadota bacterium]